MRIATIANAAAVAERKGGGASTQRAVQAFRATDFDPGLVDAWCAVAPELLGNVIADTVWDQAVELAPSRRAA